MSSTGKLFYSSEGVFTGTSDGVTDDQIGAVNGDGSGPTVIYADTTQTGSADYYGVAVDPLDGLYFGLKLNDGAGFIPTLTSGHLTGGTTYTGDQIATIAAASNDSSGYFVGGLTIDPVNHYLYIGLQGQTDADTGIYRVSYNASTGALSGQTLLIPASMGHVQSPNGLFLDVADQVLYYVDNTPQGAGAAFDNSANGVYTVNLAHPTNAPTLLTSDTVFDDGNTNPNGNITGLAVNLAKGVVYFTTQDNNYAANSESEAQAGSLEDSLWEVSTAGGTATKIGSFNGIPAANSLTYDPVGNQLYASDLATAHVVQFTLNTAGTAVTSTNYNFFTEDTNNVQPGNTYENGLSFVDAPVLSSFTSTLTHAVQGGSAMTALYNAPTLQEVNQGLGDFTGGSVQITNAQSGDILAATTTGTSISASYNATDHTLTLSGDDTAAHYAQVLGSLNYQDTGTDTSTTGHPVRDLTYTVSNGALSSTAASTITVDRAPVATADSYTVASGSSLTTANVLTNDTDADGDSLTATAAVAGTNSPTPTLNANGTFTEGLNPGYSIARFTYEASDGTTTSAPATVTIDFTQYDPKPVADTGNVAALGTLSVNATNGVISNDVDPANSASTAHLSLVGVSNTISGTGTIGTALVGEYGDLTLNADGSYTYVAGATLGQQSALTTLGTIGSDVFTYTETHTGGGVGTATLTISVGDNPPVTAIHDVSVLPGGTAAATTPIDTDPDGDTVTVTAVNGGAVGTPLAGTYGSLTINSDDTYSYAASNSSAIAAAATGAHPTDSFSYTVSDGKGGMATETLNLSIDRAPTLTDQSHAVAAGGTLTETAPNGALSGDSDPDGDTLAIASATPSGGAATTVASSGTTTIGGTYGDLVIGADGHYSYTAGATLAEQQALASASSGAYPTDDFALTVGDSGGGVTSSEALDFTLNRAPSTPVDSNPAANAVAEGAATGTAVGLTAQAADPDGDGVTYSLTADSSSGGFAVNAATGAVTVADPSKIDYAASGADHDYTVTVAASDGALSSSQSFTIAVDDVAPTISGAAPAQATDDTTSIAPFANVVIAEPGSATQEETVHVTLSDTANGVFSTASLAASGFVADGSAIGQYDFTGTAAEDTTAINQLVFTPTANQVTPGSTVTTTFAIAVGDGTASASDSSTTVVATSINDAPTITGAAAAQAADDNATTTPFSGVTIGDVDVGQTQTVTVTLNHPTYGTLSNLDGGTYTAATGIYSFSGSAADATTALDGLVFTPTANQIAPGTTETAGFTIATNDGAAPAVSDTTTTVVITSINDAPTITGTVAGQAVDDNATTTPFSAVTIGDVDTPAQTQTVTVTLDHPTYGALSDLDGGSYDATTGVYSFSGTAAQATAALHGVVFTPVANQIALGTSETEGFTVATNDGTAPTVSDAATTVVIASVNDAPTITGAVAGQAVDDDATSTPFSGVTIGDANIPAQTQTVTVTLSHPTFGVLSNLDGGTYTAATGIYSFSGTAAQATTALDALVFTPTAHQVTPGSTETEGFTIATNDGVASTVSDTTTTVVITAINDAPTITGTVAAQAVDDNATTTPFSAVTIGDVDAGQTQTVTVTLDHPTYGALSNLGGGTYAAGVYSFSGSASAATTALDGLVFTPTANQIAPGTTETAGFTVTTNDGVASTVSDTTTTVVITSINDAPTITGSVAGQKLSDTATLTPFSAVTIGDVDTPAQTQTVTVTLDQPAYGALSNLDGGTYTASTGVYSFSGTAAAATTALHGLVFTPAADQLASGASETEGFTIAASDGTAPAVSDTTTTVDISAAAPPPPPGGGDGGGATSTDQGTAGDDVLTANAGGDTVLGGAGDDTIIGGTGHDQLYGNAGNDHITLTASTDSSTVYGGMGADTLDASASTHANFISGDLGSDLITAGAGADTAYGGAGDDTIIAGGGEDQLYGNAGDDHITLGASSGGATVYGGQGDDVIDASASTHSNFISADLGNDTVRLGAGADTAYGGGGNDTLFAGSGHDQLYGQAGNDTITIGAANAGSTVYGGQGDDVIDASASTHANFISGDLGDDSIIAGSGADTLYGGAGSDTIHAGTGASDHIHVGLSDSSALSGAGAGELDHVLNFGSHDVLVFDGDPAGTAVNTLNHAGDGSIVDFAAAYAYAYGGGTQAGAISGVIEYVVVDDVAGHTYVFAANHAAVEIDGLAGGANSVAFNQLVAT